MTGCRLEWSAGGVNRLTVKVSIGVVCLFMFTLFPLTSHGQQTGTGGMVDSFGLQVGALGGQTTLDDHFPRSLFRVNARHLINEFWFGEAGLSLGVVSGPGYRTRILPLEYRGNYLLKGFGVDELELFSFSGTPYIFGGLGLLFYKPLSIPAPDDPLTAGMGAQLPGSSMWSFDSGLDPYIPVGAGLDFRLDRSTSLNLQFGYNQSLHFLSLGGGGFRQGFWGFTVGLSFHPGRPVRPEQAIPYRLSAPQLRSLPWAEIESRQIEVEVEQVQPVSDRRLNRIDGERIYFDVLSAGIDSRFEPLLEEVVELMDHSPGYGLTLAGHADSTGTDLVNEVISEIRGRAVWLALVDRGGDPNRIDYTAYRDQLPESNPDDYWRTRYRDRRVEFAVEQRDLVRVRHIPSEEEIFISPIFDDLEYGEPLLPRRQITFDGSFFELSSTMNMLLRHVSYLMATRPEMDLVILSQAEPAAGQEFHRVLSRGRADRVRKGLILWGVEPDRLISVSENGPSALFEQFRHLLEESREQNLLIPIVRGDAPGSSGEPDAGRSPNTPGQVD